MPNKKLEFPGEWEGDLKIPGGGGGTERGGDARRLAWGGKFRGLCFNMVSKKLGPRPDQSPLGV